jgi:hypothetical protein
LTSLKHDNHLPEQVSHADARLDHKQFRACKFMEEDATKKNACDGKGGVESEGSAGFKVVKTMEAVSLQEVFFIALKCENILFLDKLAAAFEKLGITPIVPERKKGMTVDNVEGGHGILLIPNSDHSKLKKAIEKLSAEFEIKLC